MSRRPNLSTLLIVCLVTSLRWSGAGFATTSTQTASWELPPTPREALRHYRHARSLARQGRKRQAYQAIKAALKAGFWDASVLARDRAFRPMQGYRPWRHLFQKLRRDQRALRWLRAEIALLAYETRAIAFEETWRIDHDVTQTYANPLPAQTPATAAARYWRAALKRAQRQQRLLVYRLHRQRTRRKRARILAQHPLYVSQYTGEVRREWTLQRSKRLARLAYKRRKQAAMLRAYRAPSPARQRGLRVFKPFAGRWRWNLRHLHKKLRLQGQITWHFSGQYWWGASHFRQAGKDQRLAIVVHYQPGKGYVCTYLQRGGVSFAAGPKEIPSKRRMLWEFGPNTRFVWDWQTAQIKVRRYALNAAESWSLQDVTTWTRVAK